MRLGSQPTAVHISQPQHRHFALQRDTVLATLTQSALYAQQKFVVVTAGIKSCCVLVLHNSSQPQDRHYALQRDPVLATVTQPALYAQQKSSGVTAGTNPLCSGLAQWHSPKGQALCSPKRPSACHSDPVTEVQDKATTASSSFVEQSSHSTGLSQLGEHHSNIHLAQHLSDKTHCT